MSFVVYINKKIYCNKYNKIREIRIEIAWASSFVVVVEVAHYKYIYIYIYVSTVKPFGFGPALGQARASAPARTQSVGRCLLILPVIPAGPAASTLTSYLRCPLNDFYTYMLVYIFIYIYKIQVLMLKIIINLNIYFIFLFLTAGDFLLISNIFLNFYIDGNK